MQRKSMWWSIGVLVLALNIGALAQTPRKLHFRGLINDYTAATGGGPWEVSGMWTLRVHGDSGKADFSAALTMVRSDYWVITSSADPNDPSTRNPHTHHIRLAHGVVTPIANGFQISGVVEITANGSTPPFGQNSTLTVQITGGPIVPYSNIKLYFGGDAAGHFGTQPLDGVVRTSE